MKFALIDERRHEPAPGLDGKCPVCEGPTVAKCGESRVWHWAHKGSRQCDPWWENETEWHRNWKEQFPPVWQEVVHLAADGERHIADVKTELGWVLEFQHSYLDPEERHARNSFYPQLVWIVDGARRKRDQIQFLKAIEEGSSIPINVPMWRVFVEDCPLLKEWHGSTAPVFLDFGESLPLWCLIAGTPDGKAYVGPFAKAAFLNFHLPPAARTTQDFAALLKTLREIVSIDIAGRTNISNQPTQALPASFGVHPSRRRQVRFRRRF